MSRATIRKRGGRPDAPIVQSVPGGGAPDRGPVFELALTTSTLIREIGMPELKQRDIASTYGLALRSSCETNWAVVNAAIIERWSQAGLERIKESAWAGKWRGVPFGGSA